MKATELHKDINTAIAAVSRVLDRHDGLLNGGLVKDALLILIDAQSANDHEHEADVMLANYGNK